MDRDQKAAVVEKIAGEIEGSDAIIAVDYRGINVPQVNELRSKLREADASFRVLKNTLTERAADKVGREDLKDLLKGPTAFTFINGDAVMAAKTLHKFIKDQEIMAFKGGSMDGAALTVDEIVSLAKLPTRDALNAQLVGMLSSPMTTVVRGLGSMISGLAVALGQLEAKKAAEAPAEAEPKAEVKEEAPKAEETSPSEEETPVEEPAAEVEAPAEEEKEVSEDPKDPDKEDTPDGEDNN